MPDVSIVYRNVSNNGWQVTYPIGTEVKSLQKADFRDRTQFAQFAQCRGHWQAYLDYRQEIVEGPRAWTNRRRFEGRLSAAVQIFNRSQRLSLHLPNPNFALETVNLIDRSRFPNEVFLLKLDKRRSIAIDNPTIVLQITMPRPAEHDPSVALLEAFQVQYVQERFQETLVSEGKDFLAIELPDGNLADLSRVLSGNKEEGFSKADRFSQYPLGIVLIFPRTVQATLVGDLVSLVHRQGARHVFVSDKDEWEGETTNVLNRLRALKYNMAHRPIQTTVSGATPADSTVKQVLGLGGWGATHIETGDLGAGLSGATVHLVRYSKNAMPTNWRVLKVDDWGKMHNEHCRYRMFVADRLPSIQARFLGGPQVGSDEGSKRKAGIEYELASTLIEDRPKSFDRAIIEAQKGEQDELRRAVENLFGRILVAWDCSWREFECEVAEVAKEMFSQKGKKDDIRPYSKLTEEYVPDLAKGIKKKAEELKKVGLTDLAVRIEGQVNSINREVQRICSSLQIKSVLTLKVCHGDLHARNILQDGQGALWVIDFGRTGLHHSLLDFITFEYSIRWWQCLWIEEGLAPVEMKQLERDLLELRYWEHPEALIEKYANSLAGKYASIIAAARKHAKRFCATKLPGLGFSEYLTCLGLKSLAAIRDNPLDWRTYCEKTQEILKKSDECARRLT